jgi:hypothetical protein
MEAVCYRGGSEFRLLYAAPANDRNRQGNTEPHGGAVFNFTPRTSGIDAYIRGSVRRKFNQFLLV